MDLGTIPRVESNQTGIPVVWRERNFPDRRPLSNTFTSRLLPSCAFIFNHAISFMSLSLLSPRFPRCNPFVPRSDNIRQPIIYLFTIHYSLSGQVVQGPDAVGSALGIVRAAVISARYRS